MSVFDIEFLTAVAPKLERHVIYFYQVDSRAMRKRLRDRVLGLFDTKSIVPRSVQARDLQEELGLSCLFPTIVVCDLEDLPNKQIIDLLAAVLKKLPNCEAQLFLLAPCEPPKNFAVQECTVIAEPLVTTKTMELVFDYCMRESKALRHARLTNQNAFREHLATKLNQASMSLRDFRCFFEHLALTAIDYTTGRFTPRPLSGDVEREEISLGLALEAFVLRDADDEALRKMLLYVARFLHQRHKSVPTLVSHIQKLTCRVIVLGQADANLRRRSLMWSIMLLAWDARLFQGPFENAFLELCQRFRESRPEIGLLRALEGHWREVAALVARYRQADVESRRQLVRLLDHIAAELAILGADGTVLPRWLLRLGSLFRTSSTNAAEPVPTMCPPAHVNWRQRDALHTFRDVLGQNQALRILMKHLEHGAGQHIIFTGPPGVGKRALARLYAMAIWCAKRDAVGSPCGACESCLGIQTNAIIDYFELDFAQSFVGVASSVEATAVVPLQFDRRINALFNIERIPRAELDQLLKVLEQVPNAVFLFTVADLSLMNAAVLSRCRVVPVLPLTPNVAVGRLESICVRENITYEPDAMRIVAAVSRYRAGALLQRLVSVTADGPVTLERARNVFGLNWVLAVVRQLAALLEGIDPFVSTASDELDDEFVERAQLLVTAADLHRRNMLPNTSYGLHPALLCLAPDWDEPLRRSLERRAIRDGASADHIWEALVKMWTNMDFCFRFDWELSLE